MEKNNLNRGATVDLARLLELDDERDKLQQKTDELRAQRNQRSKTKPSDEEIALMRKIGDEINALQKLAEEKEEQVHEILFDIPNLTHPDAPVGNDESDNKVVREVGVPPKFDFEPLEHWELGEKLGVIDVTTAAEISGSRFAYLKGRLVLVQLALMQHAFSILTDEKKLQQIIAKNNLSVPATPFIPILPPVIMRPEVMQKMSRLEPRDERYHLDQDDLYLVGSAEHTMGPMLIKKTIPESSLPLRYVGYSTAFRREAGSYGKDTKGIFRVHQFDKMEIESFTSPAQSEAEQDFIIAIQEYLMQSLGIPYRVVFKCTGDMGAPDYREFDIECWLPGQGAYRETHTSDLMTDYQSRRLNTRMKPSGEGKPVFVHMNDATVFAMGRTLIAIMENFQQADGQIVVPEVLRKYTGFESIGGTAL